MKRPIEKTIERLQEQGELTAQEVEQAEQKAARLNKNVEKVILGKDYVPRDEWLQTKGEVLDYPYRDVRTKSAQKKALNLVPVETARRYNLVPIELEGDLLRVGMIDPTNTDAKEALRFIASRKGLDLDIYLISREGYQHILRQYESFEGEVKQALEGLEKKRREEEEKEGERVKIAKPIAAESPVSKVVSVILRYGVETEASDIHIEPLENSIKVRFRIDGVLHTSLYLKKSIHSAIVTRIKILSELKIDETRVPQDGRFHAEIDEKKIDFRVSTFPTANGEKAVLRILDPEAGIFDLKGLGLQGRNLEVVKEAIHEPYGMILSSGPTGSGKTTTLYTALNILNQESVNIVSLEDPVEYFIEGVNQSQVKPEIGYSFASGLRHILRQDPDIIMAGEIRDEETASLATHAALTGHLLLSTVHTKDAVGIVPRLLDMDVERYLLPTTLSLGIAQRLARTLCSDCKEKFQPPKKIQESIREAWEKIPEEQREQLEVDPTWPLELYKAEGCEACGGTGYRGRTAIFEVLKTTPQLEEIISQDLSETNLRKEAKRQGMINMFQDGVIKVLEGIISYEDLLRVTKQ
jgi:type IV pilus assembly protein PilB